MTTEKLSVLEVDDLNLSNFDNIIESVENGIRKANATVELPLIHTFTGGLYSREMFAPKGCVITSKVHKKTHQFMLVKGSMILISAEGAFKVTAPFHGITQAGNTRIGIALEDSIWTTFHGCDLVEDKDYSEEELNELVLKIEADLVEDRKLVINEN